MNIIVLKPQLHWVCKFYALAEQLGITADEGVETNCDYRTVDKGVKLTIVYFVNCSPSDTTSST